MREFDLNAGATAPVGAEVELADLPVTGVIPPELDGVLLRNGPNPFDGRFAGATMLDWWTAPAMVHGLRIQAGRACWYRNRWIRTEAWGRHAGRDATDLGVPANPNVSIVAHHELLALGEGGPPVQLSPDLADAGPAVAARAPSGGMLAHPKIDPVTGELRYARTDVTAPYLSVGGIDATGTETGERAIDLPGPVMMHDLAITEHFDVVLDLSVVVDLSLLERPLPLRWDDEHTSRVGLVPRDGEPVRWFEISPCFVQHVVNAFENDAGVVVFDVIRYAHFLRAGSGDAHEPPGVLWRIELDPRSGTATETQLDDRAVELPHLDRRRVGREHRHVVVVEQPTPDEIRGIRRYDLVTGTSTAHVPPPGDQNSEAVLAPAETGTGWLLACVHRGRTDTSDVVVLRDDDLAAGPVATVHLPVRIPAGFHGLWHPTAA